MLSSQEFDKLKKGLTAAPTKATGQVGHSGPGYFERVGQQYFKAGENLAENIQEAWKAPGSGAMETGRAILQGAGDVAGAAFAPITEAVAPVVSPLIEKLVSVPGVRENVEKVTQWAAQHPDAAKNLEAVFNIATLGAGSAAEKPIVKGALNATGKVTEKAGQVLKGTGEKAYRVVAPMEEATARAVQAYEASKPTLMERVSGLVTGGKPINPAAPVRESETAARLGLTGTEWQLGVQAKKAAGGLWDETIQPELAKSTERVHMPTFFKDMRARVVAETPELGRRKTLLEAVDAMQEDFKKVSNISLPKLQEYKSGWAKFVPDRVYKGKPISAALSEVRNMAAQEARARIYKALGENVKQAYLDYGNLRSIIDAGIKSVDPLRSKGAFRQAWEFVLDKTVTPIASYGGKVLYRTGEGLEFIGTEGMTKIRDIITR